MSLSDDTTKVCTKCGIEYPATNEYFFPHKKCKGGLGTWCKSCHRERNRLNSAKLRENPEYREKGRRQAREWYRKNIEHAQEYNKRYYAENQERERARTHEKYLKNAERYRSYRRKRYKQNIEYELHMKHLWDERNREYVREYNRNWRKNNPDKVKIQKKIRFAREKNALSWPTTAELVELYEHQNGHCGHCGITITIDESHLEHMTPLVRGGTNDLDNLCYACQDCNLSKGSKTVAEWIAVRGW